MKPEDRMFSLLKFLYGPELAGEIWPRFQTMLDQFRRRYPKLRKPSPIKSRLTERDAFLITYADQFQSPGKAPLDALFDFLETCLQGAINGVHLLPFYPFSSDDGFAVVNYREVAPNLGGWQDIARIGENYRLMFDAVVNHVSRQSAWFQGYLRQEAPFKDYFIEMPPETDLSRVVRPRTLPLLTPVTTINGVRHVWTTFSTDQIDLNYANPEVLLEITSILLYYVSRGAEILRLDAIAYLWKEPGTPCIHLPQTHAIVKFWRAVLDYAAPNVLLISETNVPHEENISYFGNCGDEAQMVYQFPLAPLVLHTFLEGDAQKLAAWAEGLGVPSPQTAFFNFIASHDGIGLRPAEGILTTNEIQALINRAVSHGGHISYNLLPDGTRNVYELNITLYDFLNDPEAPNLHMDTRRFLASQAIMLSLAGVPGIYIHSLFGSSNCHDCVTKTRKPRSINREKLHLETLKAELEKPETRTARILSGLKHLLKQRQRHPAFHPASPQQILDVKPTVFTVLRGKEPPVVCLTNVTSFPNQIEFDLLRLELDRFSTWRCLIDGKCYKNQSGTLTLTFNPYQTMWLVPA